MPLTSFPRSRLPCSYCSGSAAALASLTCRGCQQQASSLPTLPCSTSLSFSRSLKAMFACPDSAALRQLIHKRTGITIREERRRQHRHPCSDAAPYLGGRPRRRSAIRASLYPMYERLRTLFTYVRSRTVILKVSILTPTALAFRSLLFALARYAFAPVQL